MESTTRQRLVTSARSGLRNAGKTAFWLLRIMIPVSFGVFLLRYFGVLPVVAGVVDPLFELIGLPGSAALAYVSSLLLNLYSAIAVMASITLTTRQLAILAVVCLIGHNVIVETTVQRKTGSNPVRILLLRIVGGLAVGFVLNLVLPEVAPDRAAAISARAAALVADAMQPTFASQLGAWAVDSLLTIIKLLVIIVLLMVGQKILDEFGVTRLLARVATPLVRVFGLPDSTAFLWIVANTLGLAYGSAVLIAEREAGAVDRRDADLLNHHLCVSHSLLEDTLLFVALGVGVIVLVVPRLLLAFVAVWTRRMEARFRDRSPRVDG